MPVQGSEAFYEARILPLMEDQSIAIVRNITERRQAEESLLRAQDQLRQSQKMEAVGRLAGGVAHDFNNLLTAIRGYCDLAMTRLNDPVPLRRNLLEIEKVSDRAAMLTRQLADTLRASRPEARVLFTSGYTDDASFFDGALDDRTPFLQKPFSADTLLRTIREVLEETRR